jgi:hypothetical protein
MQGFGIEHPKRGRRRAMQVKAAWMLVMALALSWACSGLTGADETPRMTKEALKGKLGDPATIVVDVRSGGSWTDSSTKIKGAVREDPAAVQNWISKYSKDKTLVFYCA